MESNARNPKELSGEIEDILDQITQWLKNKSTLEFNDFRTHEQIVKYCKEIIEFFE